MQIDKFQQGVYLNQIGYKSFIPAYINTSWEWKNPDINILLEQASAELGGLNSYSELIPNIDVYIQMHIKTEANKSSKIEGTKTSIEEELMELEDVAPEKRNDYMEVQNYILAMSHGIKRIQVDDFPLSNRLIREVHEVLMRGVRGENKTPGEFRKTQNWIGGTGPSNAVFVPPSIDKLHELLSDLEFFIHNENIKTPHLIKAALIHYQFETIHPFLDGNGRIGRLIIPLYLLSKKILDKPCFYISDYFEQNRTVYYDALQNVRNNGALLDWVLFFLHACIYTAKTAKSKFKNVLSIVDKYKNTILSFAGKADFNNRILEALLNRPILSSKQLQDVTGLSQPTVDKTLAQMMAVDMLREITGYSRNRIFVLRAYLQAYLVNGK